MSGDLQHWEYEKFKAHWRASTLEGAYRLLAEPRWQHQSREAGYCVSIG
jgi:hypothetical protein